MISEVKIWPLFTTHFVSCFERTVRKWKQIRKAELLAVGKASKKLQTGLLQAEKTTTTTTTREPFMAVDYVLRGPWSVCPQRPIVEVERGSVGRGRAGGRCGVNIFYPAQLWREKKLDVKPHDSPQTYFRTLTIDYIDAVDHQSRKWCEILPVFPSRAHVVVCLEGLPNITADPLSPTFFLPFFFFF